MYGKDYKINKLKGISPAHNIQFLCFFSYFLIDYKIGKQVYLPQIQVTGVCVTVCKQDQSKLENNLNNEKKEKAREYYVVIHRKSRNLFLKSDSFP